MPHSNIIRKLILILLANVSGFYFVANFSSLSDVISLDSSATNMAIDVIDISIPNRRVLGLSTKNSSPCERQKLITDLDPNLLLVKVDKNSSIPTDFYPDDLVEITQENIPTSRGILLRAEAAEHLLLMLNEMNLEGLDYRISSGYRSLSNQRYTHNYYTIYGGSDYVSKYVAEPGHSEHQLGTAVDILSGENFFKASADMANTSEWKWLNNNAHKYGFVMSYPEGKSDITGYHFEPWHYRYVGVEIAYEIKNSDMTLSEFLFELHSNCLNNEN